MFKTSNLYQNDPKWKDKSLGFSNEKIGGWGCLLTSITMMLNGMGYNETPDTVNDKMKSIGGFQQAFFVPSALSYAYPNVAYRGIQPCEGSPAPIGLIDAALAAGKPVILQVDWNKEAGIQTHFVLAKDRLDSDYVLYDPYMYRGDGPGKDVLLTKRYKYNGATIETEISGVLWFDGYIPPSPPEPMKEPLPAEKFIIYAAEDDLALRASPSSGGYLWKRMLGGSELISLEDKATTLSMLGQQGKWLKVQDPNGDQGYVAAWYVAAEKGAPPPASSTPVTVTASTTTTAAAPAAAPAKPLNAPPGSLLLTPTEEMSFRSQPTVSADTLIRRIPMTEQLICIEPASQAISKVGVQNQWLKAKDASGKEGYLAAWYVKYSGGTTAQAQTAQTPAPAAGGAVKVKAAVEGVAFRKQPVISDSSLIKRVPIGTEFSLTDPATASKVGLNDAWLKVKDSGGAEGYVAAWFVCK